MGEARQSHHESPFEMSAEKSELGDRTREIGHFEDQEGCKPRNAGGLYTIKCSLEPQTECSPESTLIWAV